MAANFNDLHAQATSPPPGFNPDLFTAFLDGLPDGSEPEQQQEAKRPALTTQLKFSNKEKQALRLKIEQDYRRAQDDHISRTKECARQEEAWRRVVGLAGGEEGLSNFHVQLTTALLMAKHSREVDALFGTNPSVEAVPGRRPGDFGAPADPNIAKKVSLAMKWQLYENMRALKPIALWSLRRLKHGRSFAVVDWERHYYDRTTVDEITGERKKERVLYREGPVISPLGNDEIILPASVQGITGFDSVQTAEWVIHRYWDTPTNMLRQNNIPGEEQNPEGDLYQGVTDDWARLLAYSKFGLERDSEFDSSLIEQDMAERVERDSSTTNQREMVEILKWHGKWRRYVDVEDDEAEFPVPGPTEPGHLEKDTQLGSGQYDGQKTEQVERVQEQPGIEALAETKDQVQGPAEGNPEDSDSTVEEIPGGLGEPGSTEGSPRPISVRGIGQDEGGEEGEGSSEDLLSQHPKRTDTFIDTDGIEKEMVESELIVRYCRRLSRIYGIQDAAEVYPDSPIKRPIMEMALLNDGQYWSMGLIELSEQIEKEMEVLANQIIEAIGMSIGPPVFVEPAAGYDVAQTKYEKNQIIYTTNAGGVKQLQLNPHIEAFTELWQMFLSLYEQLTGITNLVMGRGMEQPTAPRTLGGQRMVMGAGDVRLALDMRNMSEDLKHLLDWIWDLWTMFGSSEQFFRVAEGDAGDLFKDGEGLENGWAKLGAEEREGRYDFSLNFADDAQVREGKKQETAALIQMVAPFPSVAQDKVLVYRLLTDAFDAFGKDFTKYASEPPPEFAARTPMQEWTDFQDGADVHVHPADNDQAHIDDHNKRILAMQMGPKKDRNIDAMFAATKHVQDHQQALQQKAQTQALIEGIKGMLQAAQGVPQGVDPNNPMSALMAFAKQGQQGGQASPQGQPQGQPQPGM
jgi:hypothetical protein